jgi:NAD-reducing hydrogenase large subunit
MGAFESNHLSLVGDDGVMDLYDGTLRAIDSGGEGILDGVRCGKYLDHIIEEVRPWTYMKFPFLKKLGPEQGWYRVGSLARLNTCDRIDTPLAEQRRGEFFRAMGGRPNNMTMAYHWARLIEVLHAAEKIRELLDDPDISGADLVDRGARRERAVAVLEAPRGTLFHDYTVDENDLVTQANLIVSTTQNNEPMNRAVESVARRELAGGKRISEGMLNAIEVAIRAYDPCLSCATHAVGAMRLEVELRGESGEVMDRRGR